MTFNSRPYINDRVTSSYLWAKNKQKSSPKCYNCQQKSHIAKNCFMKMASVGPICQLRTNKDVSRCKANNCVNQRFLPAFQTFKHI